MILPNKILSTKAIGRKRYQIIDVMQLTDTYGVIIKTNARMSVAVVIAKQAPQAYASSIV